MCDFTCLEFKYQGTQNCLRISTHMVQRLVKVMVSLEGVREEVSLGRGWSPLLIRYYSLKGLRSDSRDFQWKWRDFYIKSELLLQKRE